MENRIGNSIVFVGQSGSSKDDPQVLMMVLPEHIISGTHEKEHSFFISEIEDNEEFFTLKIKKDTMKSSTDHMESCIKRGCSPVELNYLTWGDILRQKVWGFIEYTKDQKRDIKISKILEKWVG